MDEGAVEKEVEEEPGEGKEIEFVLDFLVVVRGGVERFEGRESEC